MGLPGAGKTTLAASVAAGLLFNKVLWLNADTIRERFDDWDFTIYMLQHKTQIAGPTLY